MTAPSEQLVEWVDADGRTIGIVTRRRVRSENLRHRSVYVVVADATGALVVHRRAEWKDVWPGYWDVAFGGLVNVGEPWAAAARRELAEEAGLEAPELVALGAFSYDDPAVSLLGQLFATVCAGAVVPRDGEVVEVDRVPLAELERWVAERPVCPDSLACVVPVLLRGGWPPGAVTP